MISDAVMGALVASITGLIGICLSKTKCHYSNHNGKCERRCAFMDSKLIDDKEINIEHIQANGVELIAVTRRKADDDEDSPSTPSVMCSFPPNC